MLPPTSTHQGLLEILGSGAKNFQCMIFLFSQSLQDFSSYMQESFLGWTACRNCFLKKSPIHAVIEILQICSKTVVETAQNNFFTAANAVYNFREMSIQIAVLCQNIRPFRSILPCRWKSVVLNSNLFQVYRNASTQRVEQILKLSTVEIKDQQSVKLTGGEQAVFSLFSNQHTKSHS